MNIVRITEKELEQIAPLVAEFRVTLKAFRGIASQPDLCAGRDEAAEYLEAGFPCFAVECEGEMAGYIVCRVDEPCVWVESIYVRPAWRRHGIASALFAKAEEIAAGYGEETLFNYVHPNNHEMIGFLRKHGYTVLNLVEIRKPCRDEALTQKIAVGEHEFDY